MCKYTIFGLATTNVYCLMAAYSEWRMLTYLCVCVCVCVCVYVVQVCVYLCLCVRVCVRAPVFDCARVRLSSVELSGWHFCPWNMLTVRCLHACTCTCTHTNTHTEREREREQKQPVASDSTGMHQLLFWCQSALCHVLSPLGCYPSG